MQNNLKIIRIQNKIGELFKDMIDLSDVNSQEEKSNKFFSRAIAAL